jgi:hypothetical protein
VIDVTLFLLLVSAATLAVTTATAPTERTDAAARDEATVETLATTTATVRYDLGVDSGTNESITRVTHGSLAELLADAALASVAADDQPPSPYSAGFVEAVSEAVRSTVDGRTQVVATWTPHPGSTVAGRVRVGPSPPPASTVHAATLAVDSGSPARPTPVANESYEAVGEAVATRVVSGLFPSRRTRAALAGDGADATVTRDRFRSIRVAYGSNTTLETDVARARGDLTDAVAVRSRAELRRTFETPQQAAAAVSVGRVTIVVRTWS